MFTAANLIGAIKVKQQEIAASLANGNASTWEAYQRLVGQHVGLQETLTLINQLLEEEKRNVE